MNIIFLCSLTLLLYTFIGYPLALRMIKKEKVAELLPAHELPEITVVLCIYNSANLLNERVNNILSADYPFEKINLLIVSDGSTDRPDIVISKLNNSKIKLVHYDTNKGKSCALNIAQQHVHTSVVAFADVRQSFEPSALRYLASSLMNDDIGAVSGNLKIKAFSNSEE